ncbi:MAG: hypothetical protein JWQ40_3668 [Segetibacter sp.]|jgi:hypothetical protein|nr:hypothetical protein [Segetibacter sp.]
MQLPGAGYRFLVTRSPMEVTIFKFFCSRASSTRFIIVATRITNTIKENRTKNATRIICYINIEGI